MELSEQRITNGLALLWSVAGITAILFLGWLSHYLRQYDNVVADSDPRTAPVRRLVTPVAEDPALPPSLPSNTEHELAPAAAETAPQRSADRPTASAPQRPTPTLVEVEKEPTLEPVRFDTEDSDVVPVAATVDSSPAVDSQPAAPTEQPEPVGQPAEGSPPPDPIAAAPSAPRPAPETDPNLRPFLWRGDS